jgi:hypothetical protein
MLLATRRASSIVSTAPASDTHRPLLKQARALGVEPVEREPREQREDEQACK